MQGEAGLPTQVPESSVRESTVCFCSMRSSIIVEKTNIRSLCALSADDVCQSPELGIIGISRHCDTTAEKLVVKHPL
ncbi:hypothetical protein Y032_0345g3105 [Ancylostoma ceylanicum]|uniref:Uncharacterized protein n=1 Tax=Ancylostoma ceylanicum TaxID=53326 RepID=A0A016RXF5_9BILA|nr:hypothetical protein Y032_0345g3105 [Ancylostoma ceylanicum]